MGMSTPVVVAVVPGSAAAAAGLQPGDELVTLNGEMPRDVIRYQVLVDEPVVEIEVRRGGLEQLITVENSPGTPFGAEVDSAIFDQVRTCDNHCPFCFIYQLPKGMRRSLYLKDDDYRLSFLYGNFTTLTRFTEADLERVIDEGLGPLYVSIHATDPEVRSQMLRNRRGATSLRWLRLLLDQGVEVHGQVVVCPGVNDGDVLDDTLLGVLDRYPQLATVAVVPLGVSSYNREETMRVHTKDETIGVLDTVDRWQGRFIDALGRRLVFAADEYYLLAGREFPTPEEYEGFPQHENGIGMARAFEADVRNAIAGSDDEGHGQRHGFFAWVEGADQQPERSTGSWKSVQIAEPEGYRAPRSTPGLSVSDSRAAAGQSATSQSANSRLDGRPQDVVILTGDYGAMVLDPLLPELSEAARSEVRTLAVSNGFFGGNIAVTGLLTGADIAAALEGRSGDARYLLPDVTLSRGLFLDGATPADLPIPVEVVPTSGAALVAALQAAALQAA